MIRNASKVEEEESTKIEKKEKKDERTIEVNLLCGAWWTMKQWKNVNERSNLKQQQSWTKCTKTNAPTKHTLKMTFDVSSCFKYEHDSWSWSLLVLMIESFGFVMSWLLFMSSPIMPTESCKNCTYEMCEAWSQKQYAELNFWKKILWMY